MTRQVLVQSFVLPWAPTAKGRPRFGVHQGRPMTYTPERTRVAEHAIRLLLRELGAWCYPREYPLELSVIFGLTRPKDGPTREMYPPRRPDLTNYLMLLADASAGVLWADDAQLVSIHASKSMSDVPRITLTVGVLLADPLPKAGALMAYERRVLASL